MYKVVIAEDEMFVRLGIKMSVDWEKLGMEVAADVENGQQALEAWESFQPDIVITDIKMPVMDGIELIRRIRQKDERTRFIILSCLEEFNTVREALSLGVSDYVLKLTMTQEDMEKVLEKVKRELVVMDRSQKTQENGIERKRFEDSLRNFLYYRLDMGQEWKMKIREQFSDPEKQMQMVALEIDHYMESKRIFNDSYGSILDSAVENILSELLVEENHILLPEKDCRFIVILEEEQDSEILSLQMSQRLEKMREVLKRCVKSTVSFAISQRGNSCDELYEMYHQCGQALEKKFFYGLDRNNVFAAQSPHDCRMLIHRKMGRLIQKLKMDEAAAGRFHEAEEGFCQHENPVTIRHYFEHGINVEMCRILPEGQQRYQITEQFMTRLKDSQTFDGVLEVYESCMEYLQGSTEEQALLSKPIKDILFYISLHYQEDITLDQVSQMVELSRTYVCGLFKKELGVNLTNYIMNYRIEKAKELLRSTNLRSYEIAEKVGFLDESYFSRTFKKVTGQSPNSFKKGV